MKTILFLSAACCILAATDAAARSRHTRAIDDRLDCPNPPQPRPPNRVNTTTQVNKLREEMANTAELPDNQRLDAYITLISDDHGTSGAKWDARVEYISGFSGSNGYTIVTANDAALWTDGRYFLQAEYQLECFWKLMKMSTEGYVNGPTWLAQTLPQFSRVGAYPNYLTIDTWKAYESALSAKNITMIPVTEDLVNKVWDELDPARPPQQRNPVYPHPIEFAGKTTAEKLVDIRQEMVNEGTDLIVVTTLEEVAWLFNLRGTDRTDSLFYGYALIYQDKASRLFIHDVARALNDATLRTHLRLQANGDCNTDVELKDCVQLVEYSSIEDQIRADNSQNIWLNPTASYAIYSAVREERIKVSRATPIALMKAMKNEVEQAKFFDCIMRDSAAVVEFVAKLEREIGEGKLWDEISAADELRKIRSEYPNFKGLSFDTISGVGPNGAVIHYRATEATKRNITTTEMYLLDSGGQYLDGTTDVTRTFHFGTPNDIEKEAYTRVLMGAIDLATTVWPKGTYGRDIDGRARAPIWQNGWDYNHGTGHGIGYFLSVHEGPGRINIGYDATHAPLYEGMFFSDEPGFYKDGEFGVRLETLVGVVKANTTYNFNNVDYLTFRPATLVPFEPKLIKAEMLSRDQLDWLNDYHRLCEQETAVYLRDERNSQEGYDWILARTATISGAAALMTSSTVFAALIAYVLLFLYNFE